MISAARARPQSLMYEPTDLEDEPWKEEIDCESVYADQAGDFHRFNRNTDGVTDEGYTGCN